MDWPGKVETSKNTFGQIIIRSAHWKWSRTSSCFRIPPNPTILSDGCNCHIRIIIGTGKNYSRRQPFHHHGWYSVIVLVNFWLFCWSVAVRDVTNNGICYACLRRSHRISSWHTGDASVQVLIAQLGPSIAVDWLHPKVAIFGDCPCDAASGIIARPDVQIGTFGRHSINRAFECINTQ